MVLEPILKEPGDIAFTWLEIYRSKSNLLQQFDVQMQMNVTSTSNDGNVANINNLNNNLNNNNNNININNQMNNDSMNEFGFYQRETDCEHKCPEIEACIAASLWCDSK